MDPQKEYDRSPLTQWKAYSEHRDSCIGWLGAMPSHWKVKKLKYGYLVTLGKMLQPQPSSSLDSLEPYLRAANVYWEGIDTTDIKEMWFAPHEKIQYSLQKGDLIVCEGGEVGRSSIWNGVIENCYIQNAVHRLRNKQGYSNEFLYYWLYVLKVIGFIDLICNKATIAHLTADKLLELQVACPPIHEQIKISHFLNRETSKIDSLIQKKQRLIELLQEKSNSTVNHAVTKGINDNVKMKESGIPTIGRIPDHWKVQRNKRIFEEINERSNDGSEELLSVSHLTGVTPRSEKNVNMFLAESMEGYKVCRPNDLVINTMWAWMGALGITAYHGIVSPSYNVYRLKKKYCSQYLDYLYRTSCYISEINRYSKGVWSSRLRLYPDEFFEMYTITPPLAEQLQIVECLKNQLSRYQNFINKLSISIDKLQEYRTALISAAVTGKIDVRQEIV